MLKLSCWNRLIRWWIIALSSRYVLSAQSDMMSRIVGGSTTKISDVPYLVSLRSNGQFFCGGSLVTSRHVVTAAHCIRGVTKSSLMVVAGATYLSEPGVRSKVERIFSPKSYTGNSFHMDVAVLRLSTALTGNNIETIKLCNVSYKAGDLVQVSGWGLSSEKSKKDENRVRTIKVPLIAKSSCVRSYRNVARLTWTMLCASVPGSKDACSGDSGGPAVFKGQLCGIVSWGVGCARRSYPGVYTSVKSVKTFIQNAINM